VGTRGPKSTPQAELDRRDSWRSGPDGDSPEVVNADLEPPSWLAGAALEMWRDVGPDLLAAGMLAKVDRLAFAILCQAQADYRGSTEPRWRKEWASIVIRLCKEFGMTWASRGAVVQAPKMESEKDRFFKIAG